MNFKGNKADELKGDFSHASPPSTPSSSSSSSSSSSLHSGIGSNFGMGGRSSTSSSSSMSRDEESGVGHQRMSHSVCALNDASFVAGSAPRHALDMFFERVGKMTNYFPCCK